MKIPKHDTRPARRFDGFRGPTVDTPKVSVPPFDAIRDAAQRFKLFQAHTDRIDAHPQQTFTVNNPVTVSVMCLGGMGGSGNVARTCAAELANAGHNVHVLSSSETFYKDARSGHVQTHSVNVPETPKEPDASWVDPLKQQIIDHVLANDVEILDVHYIAGLLDAAAGAKAALAEQGYDLKLVATLHGSDVSIWGKNPKHKEAIARQLGACDDVTCVSHHLAAQAQEVFGLEVRPRVIENSIDSVRFHPAQWSNIRQRIAPYGERIFCHVSNMRAVKRPLDAIDTFAKVRKAGVAAKLLLIGDGPMLGDMYERAVQHGVADDILCTGPLPPDKLAKYVASSDAVLVTSETESFCLAALEGMACGTPVVGTMCGGLEEIMANVAPGENGGVSSMLAPVGDSDKLASIAIDLFSDPARYEEIQAQCAAVPIEVYPADHQARGYLERIEDLRPAGLVRSSKPRPRPTVTHMSALDVRVETIRQHLDKSRPKKD